jgi:hypothetical protein
MRSQRPSGSAVSSRKIISVSLAALTLAVLSAITLVLGAPSAPGSARTPVRLTAAHQAVPVLTVDAAAFRTASRGYGLFSWSAGNSCTGDVGVLSRRGARVGRLVPVDRWACGQYPAAAALAADGHGDVFAYNPRLLVSHDGGRTWARSRVPGQVLTVATAPGSTWLLTATKCRSAKPSGVPRCRLELLESRNGVRSWRPSAAPLPARAFAATGAASASLVRAGTGTGYVVGTPGPSAVPLWITRDGGRSWTRRSVPCLRGAQ